MQPDRPVTDTAETPPAAQKRIGSPPDRCQMPSISTETPEAEPEKHTDRSLVVAIEDDELRHWVMSEFEDAWPGPILVFDRVHRILRASGDRFGTEPVLLICGRNLSIIEEVGKEDWRALSRRMTVVLVASRGNPDLVRRHFPHVDAILEQDLHKGMAVGVVRSARSGVRGFPPDLVERLLAHQDSRAASGAGKGNGIRRPRPAPGKATERRPAPPSRDDAGPNPPRRPLLDTLRAILRRVRGRTKEK